MSREAQIVSSTRVLIYNPFGAWPFHLETDLEVAHFHVQRGHDVWMIQCGGALATCEANTSHDSNVCKSCDQRRKNGLQLTGLAAAVKLVALQNLSPSEQSIIDEALRVDMLSLDALRGVTVDGADVGLAAASSLISLLREPRPDVIVHRDLVQRFLRAALVTYFSFKRHLGDLKPDVFYVFNGRLACVRPALRAAQQLGVHVRVLERAGVRGRYTVTEGTYPHDPNAYGKLIKTHWSESVLSDAEKKRIAQSWFQDRRDGKSQGWDSYTVHQKAGVPATWAAAAVKVAVFNSSEDEYAAIREWDGGVYPNQEEAIGRIAGDLATDTNVSVLLRVHPNLATVTNSQTRGIARLQGRYRNLTIIGADNPANTYEIVDAADLVLVFNSTVGIEAIHAGKPVLTLARTAYDELLLNHVASHDDLIACIRARSFMNPDMANQACRESAAQFAFLQAQGGEPFTLFEQVDTFDIRYRGAHIVPNDFLALKRIRGVRAFTYEATRRLAGSIAHRVLGSGRSK